MYKLQRWVKGRLNWLANSPLCVECERQGTITAATVVDHIIPHKGDWGLFYDVANWQSLCESCHAKKTRSEA